MTGHCLFAVLLTLMSAACVDSASARASDPPAPVRNAVAEEPKQDADDRRNEPDTKSSKPEANLEKGSPASRLRLKLDSFLAGNTEEFSVPDIDEVDRGKKAKLPSFQQRVDALVRAFRVRNEMQILETLGFDEKLILGLISDPKKRCSSVEAL